MNRLLTPKVLGAVAVVLIAMIASVFIAPVPLPGIQLPAEPVALGPITLPNTFIHTLVADIIVLGIAIAATRNMSLVPGGLQNLAEWMVEGFYNLTEDVSGDYARKFFPWVMTIFLLVLVANWLELVPGVDSIGWLESHEGLPHYPVVQVIPGVRSIVEGETIVPEFGEEAGAEEEAVDEVHEAEDHAPLEIDGQEYAVLVPFLRASATDLNFTFALALISMFMVQVYGIQALGGSYFTKFINFSGPMDFFVGLIELISEFAKIISFAFRLFGNIFGGQVLLFVMAFLVPWLLPVPFYALEIFVGFIQAFVFAMLTLVFFAVAVIPHHGEHH
ncbi:MAG: F0F1 ATP synthase subunit A [Chloroflexota bacterium]|nr:F0F1 ATP synthase subunit A [Chloroflexota bacterium]